MNKGQTHVGVVWILGGLAIWSSALSVSMFNDHAALAQISQQVADINETINSKVVPALQPFQLYRQPIQSIGKYSTSSYEN